jgi:hypothetical protein
MLANAGLDLTRSALIHPLAFCLGNYPSLTQYAAHELQQRAIFASNISFSQFCARKPQNSPKLVPAKGISAW